MPLREGFRCSSAETPARRQGRLELGQMAGRPQVPGILRVEPLRSHNLISGTANYSESLGFNLITLSGLYAKPIIR